MMPIRGSYTNSVSYCSDISTGEDRSQKVKPMDKDSVIRYSRAVRRLHDRRLAQVANHRETEAASRCASWHVETSHLSPAASPISASDGQYSPSSSVSDFSAGAQRYGSMQCLSSVSCHQRVDDGVGSNTNNIGVQSRGRNSMSSSWTPLGRKQRFSSFWSLNSTASMTSEGCLDRSMSMSESTLKNDVTRSAHDVRSRKCDVTDMDSNAMEGLESGVRITPRAMTRSNLQQSRRYSLDLERRQNVSQAIGWVRDQMEQIHEANQQLADQMSTMLGSVKSLRSELEEDDDNDDDITSDLTVDESCFEDSCDVRYVMLSRSRRASRTSWSKP